MKMFLFFHGMLYVAFPIYNNAWHANRNGKAASKAVLVVQIVLAWGVHLCILVDISFSNHLQPYLFCDRGTGDTF